MAHDQFRQQFEAALQPFCDQHGLSPVWYSDTLMCMEPREGSKSAKLCLDIEPGYWDLFGERDAITREDAISNVTGQLVKYHVEWHGQIAQTVRATISAL